MRVRVTGVVIEDGRLLLLGQGLGGPRPWSLPGGVAQAGESLADVLARGIREGTGARVEPVRLLYVSEHLAASTLHVTLEAHRVGGRLGTARGTSPGPDGRAEFVDLDDLAARGFSDRWVRLCRTGFPGAGSYVGSKATLGL